MSHGGIKLVIYIGIGGVFGFLIGVLLITAAIAVWVNPAHRGFYGIAGVILGIASFPASNLGGFFLGMLLAVIGGALAFAWTPSPPAGSLATPPATAGIPGSAGDRLDEPTGPTGGLATPGPGTSGGDADHGTGSGRAGDGTPREGATGDADGEGHWAGEYGSGDGPAPQGSAGRTLALAVMPLAMAAGMAGSGATATPQPTPTCVLGVICMPGSSSPATPSPSGTPSPTSGTPAPSPGGSPTTSPTPTGQPAPGPSAPGAGRPSAGPTGSAAARAKKAMMRKATASAGLVAPTSFSVITAGSATMDHFVYQGTVQMPSAGGGTVTMMKFTASSLALSGDAADAITESGVTVVTSSSTMSFDGSVVLYTTKLSGSLAGVPVTFTPTTISDLLLKFTNLVTGAVPITLTAVTTEQAMGTADSLTYGGGFSVSFR